MDSNGDGIRQPDRNQTILGRTTDDPERPFNILLFLRNQILTDLEKSKTPMLPADREVHNATL